MSERWRAVRDNMGGAYCVVDEQGQTIARIARGGAALNESLASQISAVPDMLAALRQVRDRVLESDRARNTPGWESIRGIVDAAISAATPKPRGEGMSGSYLCG